MFKEKYLFFHKKNGKIMYYKLDLQTRHIAKWFNHKFNPNLGDG